jgi:uncharacterized protein YbjT (DUF2867 family)
MAAHKIVVLGGAGFVGKAICRAAVQNGMKVTSVTRSGLPGSDRPWATKVNWVAADATDPASYEEHMEGATSVVHSIGILMENSSYKKFLNKEGVSTQSNAGCTYETMNRDTALVVAALAAKKKVSSFIYVSAAGAPPGIDRRYISTKREAEQQISDFKEFRSIILRPGFIFSEEFPKTLALALPLLGADSATAMVPGFQKFLGSMLQSRDIVVGNPIALHVLATAVVEAIRSPASSGIFDVSAIKRLADEAF